MVDTQSPCYSVDDMDIIHIGHKDTGRRVKSKGGTGVKMEIWICKCGKNEWEVLPKELRK